MARVRWYDSVEKDLGFGNAVREVKKVGVKTLAAAQATAPRDTGSLAQSLDFWQLSAGTRSLGRIGVLNASINFGAGWRYEPAKGDRKKSRRISASRPTNADVLMMQHLGRNLIVARNAPFLQFRGRAGHVIRTQYTTGYPRNPFLVNAFKKSCPYPVVEFYP